MYSRIGFSLKFYPEFDSFVLNEKEIGSLFVVSRGVKSSFLISLICYKSYLLGGGGQKFGENTLVELRTEGSTEDLGQRPFLLNPK